MSWIRARALTVGLWLVRWGSDGAVDPGAEARETWRAAQVAHQANLDHLAANLRADIRETLAETLGDVGNSLRHEILAAIAATHETKQSAFQRLVASLRPKAVIQTPEAEPSDHRCEICDVALPGAAVRTHDGHWRCREHKATA